ncbi:hypothetical protein [Bradyrhizobium genosp. A]|uniref:hypothetical protein n=1 Tax=Bradyrhizobium genosp. A TaxID=83626 RepID=UPI003CEC773E
MNQKSTTIDTDPSVQDRHLEHAANGGVTRLRKLHERSLSLYGFVALAGIAGLLIGLWVGSAEIDPFVKNQPSPPSMTLADTQPLP